MSLNSPTSQHLLNPWEAFQDRLLKQAQDFFQLSQLIVEDPSKDVVHRLRVLTRRLRASWEILEKIKPTKLLKKGKKSLEKISDVLGEIRSLDVSTQLLKKKMEEYPRRMGMALKKALKKKARKARNPLNNSKFQKKLDRSQEALDEVASLEFGEAAIFSAILSETQTEGAEEVLQSWKVFEEKKTLSSLHGLRIALKKWRYSREIEEQISLKTREPTSDKVKALQERLGDIHDLEVLSELLKTKSLCRKAKLMRRAKPLRQLRKALKWEIKGRTQDLLMEGRKPLFTLVHTRSA